MNPKITAVGMFASEVDGIVFVYRGRNSDRKSYFATPASMTRAFIAQMKIIERGQKKAYEFAERTKARKAASNE